MQPNTSATQSASKGKKQKKPIPDKKLAGKPVQERPVIYPELKLLKYIGDKAMTAARAKELLGWVEVTDEDVNLEDSDLPPALLTDYTNKQVRTLNNIRNRPFYMGNAEAYAQEHLMKRWKVNGEPLIIGRSGLTLNCQHRLVSLILAEQLRQLDSQEDNPRWSENWPDKVTMECIVVVGISEDDETINTMDTCRPRSLADVIYRSPHFAALPGDERKKAAKLTEDAIKMLWNRTGVKQNAFALAKVQTHSESMDFIARHPRLLRCVRHILSEDRERSIAKYIQPGYASGMLYLMGSSTSDGEKYRKNISPGEKSLDWDNWDRACEFWVGISSPTPRFQTVRNALGALADPETGTGGSLGEKAAVLAKAWRQFSAFDDIMTGEFDEEGLKLAYKTNDEGIRRLVEHPTCGGIDAGSPGRKRAIEEESRAADGEFNDEGDGNMEDDDMEAVDSDDDLTPEEIAERAAQVKQSSLEAKTEKAKQEKRERDKNKLLERRNATKEEKEVVGQKEETDEDEEVVEDDEDEDDEDEDEEEGEEDEDEDEDEDEE